MPWSELEGPAKLLAICVAIFLVSSGLCGMEFLIAGMAGARANSLVPLFIAIGVLSLIAIAISVVVGFIALILWAVGLKGSKRGPDPGA
jgi:hypothetical protein